MRHCVSLTLFAALAAVLFSSCFTGIESTPRISAGDVRKRDAAELTPEQKFLNDVVPQKPSEWTPGKSFHITDDKISIIFSPGEADVDSLNGHELRFVRFEEAPSVTGKGSMRIIFTVDGRDSEYVYPVNITPEDLAGRQRLEVPFTVERHIVDGVNAAMKDRRYFITTPKWFDAADDKAVTGRRHIPVTVSRVEAGTYIYPLRVYFIADGETAERWIPMTIGTERSATRNFARLFNFDDPRSRYPQIKDETWDLIVHSRVTEGMTRDECRLALGSPDSYRTIPVTNAIVEQWSYSEGIYLLFEDGILTRYRI